MSLTDFEQTIRTYIENKVREEYPELSLDSGTQLSDLFINPFIEVMKPILNLVNRMELTHDLSNAEDMTTEELNELGEGNYGIFRNSGDIASGYIYVSMNPEYVGPDQVVIGPITAATTGGLEFRSTSPTIIKYYSTEEVSIDGTVVSGIASDYLNTDTGKYEFPIFVYASAEGEDYNVDAGTITNLITQYPLLNNTVTNKESFINGTATEDNASYAERLKMSWSSRQLGSIVSYKSYILSTFNNVYDVLVQGYNDPLMKRDTILVKEGLNYILKHIGGKIDIYLKGSKYGDTSQSSYVNSDIFRLSYPYLVSEKSITIKNKTNPSNSDLKPVISYQYPATQTGYTDVTVTAGISEVLPESGDQLEIVYQSYIDETKVETLWFTDTMYYKSNVVRLVHQPHYSINGLSLDLPGILPSQTGLGTTEVKLPSTFSSENDLYNSKYIHVFINNSWIIKKITDYDGTSKIATVDTAYSSHPFLGNSFVIKDIAVSLADAYTVERELILVEETTVVSQAGLSANQFKLNSAVAVPSKEFYVGSTLNITSGTGSGQTRTITDYNIVTLVCTLESNLTTVPDTSSEYQILALTHLENSSKDTVNITFNSNKMIGTSTPAFMAGSVAEVFYNYDTIIEDIQWDLDVENNRIIATDTLVRQATPSYLYIGLKLVTNSGETITATDKLALQTIIENYLLNTEFNSSIKTAYLISEIYNNEAIMKKINYIQLPVVIFSSLTIIDDLTEEELLAFTDANHCKSMVEFVNAEYPVLRMLAIELIN